MSILIFLGVLFILVLVHELGHFTIAKLTGMRVDEFGIGFPPKLFGIKRGETLYSFNAFPIGGFVKIFGEDGEGDDGNKKTENRSFTSKSKFAQSAVLLAGVTMNVLFAWFLVAIAFGIGVKSSVDETIAGPNASLTVTNVLKESPAEKAGLKSGVIIRDVQADGEKLAKLTPSAFSNFVGAHADSSIAIAFTENGELRAVQVVPLKHVIEGDTEKVAIGVALTQVDIIDRTVRESIRDSFMYVISGLTEITVGIGKLIADAVQFKADFSQVAGPVGIVGLVGEASAFGITSLLMFTAFISLNLAVINVLPFPALDGGRFLIVTIEALIGSPIKPQIVGTINTLGFFILIALMIVVTWNDIVRLF